MRDGAGRLDSLTSLRAFAALAVLLLHAVGNRSNPSGLADIPWLSRFAETGYLGVPFFFSLSGFVLAWGHRGRLAVSTFYRRRFARIYPVHALTALLFLATALLLDGGVDWFAVVVCFLLVQAWIPDPDVYFALNGASWSLSCEAFFYAVSPVLLPWILASCARRRLTLAGTLATVSLVLGLLTIGHGPLAGSASALWVNPFFNLFLFVSGACAASAVRDGRCRRVPWTFTVGLLTASFVGVMWLSWATPLPRSLGTIIFAPAMLALIVSAAQSDLAGIRGPLRRRWLVRLGEWSFALYMLSGLVLEAAQRVSGPLDGVRAHVGLIVLIAVAQAVAGVAYTTFERPVERRLRPSSPIGSGTSAPRA